MVPESLDQKLAQFLRNQRGDNTFSQFARKVGLTESTLHRIENGQQSATLRAVQQILKRLDCSYTDIFETASGSLKVADDKKPLKPGPAKPTSYRRGKKKS